MPEIIDNVKVGEFIKSLLKENNLNSRGPCPKIEYIKVCRLPEFKWQVFF